MCLFFVPEESVLLLPWLWIQPHATCAYLTRKRVNRWEGMIISKTERHWTTIENREVNPDRSRRGHTPKGSQSESMQAHSQISKESIIWYGDGAGNIHLLSRNKQKTMNAVSEEDKWCYGKLERKSDEEEQGIFISIHGWLIIRFSNLYRYRRGKVDKISCASTYTCPNQ